MKMGTFDAHEMGFPMRYAPSINTPCSPSYSLLKYFCRHFRKNTKIQNFQFSRSFVDWLIVHIPEELASDFSINGKPKANAKNPP